MCWRQAPVPVVIDHYGLYGNDRPGSADGRRLLDLMSLHHVWMKLSAPYRHDRGPLNTRPDREWLAALIAAAPDRCVWGSDWPHPPSHEQQQGASLEAPYRALSYRNAGGRFSRGVAVRPILRAHHARQCGASVRVLGRGGPLMPTGDIARYSITSSASASTCGGNSMPSAFAVLRLTTNSNFADCTTGKSAGFSPLRIRAA